MTEKPVLPVIHHLARSGGTIMSRCIACMDNIAMLSEVHPDGLHYFNGNHHPFLQGANRLKLLTQEDCEKINSGQEYTFREMIVLVQKRAAEKGKILVVRDWTHLDFCSVPYHNNPTYNSKLVSDLEQDFTVIRTCTVRHPIDQWISSLKLPLLAKDSHFTVERFLHDHLKFTELAVKIGYLRYENFTKNPGESMKLLCERLQLPYDSGFIAKWPQYQYMTGDMNPVRQTDPQRMQVLQKIVPLPRPNVHEILLEQFRSNADYNRSLELLGYEENAYTTV